jgi:hypothetical protein
MSEQMLLKDLSALPQIKASFMPTKSAIRIGGKCFQEAHQLAYGTEVSRLARSDPKAVKAGKIPFSMENPLYIVFLQAQSFLFLGRLLSKHYEKAWEIALLYIVSFIG